MEALAAAAEGRPSAVVVQGPAGIGKSRLVARFVDGLGAGLGPAPVVRGACHERETIPYPLLDAAVDSLAVHLSALSADELHALLPPGARELARVFPVLEGLPAISELPAPAADEGAAEPPRRGPRSPACASSSIGSRKPGRW